MGAVASSQSASTNSRGSAEEAEPPIMDDKCADAAPLVSPPAQGFSPIPGGYPTAGLETHGPYTHRRTAGEVYRCKKGHRTDVKPEEWTKFGYWKNEEVIHRPIVCDGAQTLPLPRIKRSEITVKEFFDRFLLPQRPCIIEGAIDHWPGVKRWNLEQLLERLRNSSLKVGEDDKGRKLRMKFKYYHDYMKVQRDDSPLYLFETRVDQDPVTRGLLDDWEIPDLFPHDFFNLVNQPAKPPYRWWSIGPKRSGTTVHNDPLGTAAWNAVTHGKKRWVLFEPEVPARLAKGKDVIDKSSKMEDDEAIMYFDYLLPRIKAKHPDVRVYEAVQGPGEVIFVPGNWWHGVLNIEDAISATQNYCGLDNFDTVWVRTRKERKKLAWHWLRNMRKFAPELHARAVALNKRDGYKLRHERNPNDSASSTDSSSSESSSDSSSDAGCDLDLSRTTPCVAGITLPWLQAKGAGSEQSAPPPPPPKHMQPPPPQMPPPGTAAADGCSALPAHRKRPYPPAAQRDVLDVEMIPQPCA
eukprot:gnl/TRDRNA2_/TRDRNA2_33615_c0_seq1.p1 gnl/TRDRNA2_/TRDRNA2_33615_c0~~gnl/TRDRNA2_/TRDRNA2_33615_c0_seq1.p1  ORF type:complete len:524 (-),score=98.03 gnl/TRDRNA2_/TRDRNA2_33615_c0_seq1:22-1593(-)